MSNADEDSPTRDRILHMLAAGQLTTAEADELLAALHRRNVSWQRFANPFEWLRTSVTWRVAITTAIVGIACARFGIVFDGAIDMHVVRGPHSLVQTILEAFVNWPLLAAFLWAGMRPIGARRRFVDMMATVGAARAPLVLCGILTRLIIGEPPTDLDELAQVRLLIASLLVVLPLSILFLAWLWKAFRTVSGQHGARAVASFIISLLVAEIASKLILAAF